MQSGHHIVIHMQQGKHGKYEPENKMSIFSSWKRKAFFFPFSLHKAYRKQSLTTWSLPKTGLRKKQKKKKNKIKKKKEKRNMQ